MMVETYDDGQRSSRVDLRYFEAAAKRAARHAEELAEFGVVCTWDKPVYEDTHERYTGRWQGELGRQYTRGRLSSAGIGKDLQRSREIRLMRKLHTKKARLVMGIMDPDVIAEQWELLNARQGLA